MEMEQNWRLKVSTILLIYSVRSQAKFFQISITLPANIKTNDILLLFDTLYLNISASNLLFGDCQRTNTLLCLLCAALAISLTVIALLIYTIKKNSHGNKT